MNPTWLLGIIIAVIVGSAAIHLADAADVPSNPALDPPPEQTQVVLSDRVSLKSLDLSRAPITPDIMAAGQLGGPLFPTHELKDKRREESANLAFGKAIEKWNRHEYTNAVTMFMKYLQDFPDSSWAAEASLHIGCDATYNERYGEAEEIFQKLIADNQGKDHPGSKMMVCKATQRLALVKVEQNNLEEAGHLFSILLQESPDWRHRTYASHWIQRLHRYAADRRLLADCGTKALAEVLRKKGREKDAEIVGRMVPTSELGYSLRALKDMATRFGLTLTGVEVSSTDELDQVPLPAILQIPDRDAGNKGHYWILEKVKPDDVELFDPQSGRRFSQTLQELRTQWDGKALVVADSKLLPWRVLADTELDSFCGQCCGAPNPPSNIGNPGGNGGGCEGECCGGEGGIRGAPSWRVNVVNMNLFVKDIPLWYEPAIGPQLAIALSYNSQSSITYNEPFGNKWQFNYASYLVVDTSGSVMIFMPDGRIDVYSPDGGGGYRKPYQVFNSLTKIAENHFELRFPDDTVYVYRIPSGTGSQQPFLTEIRDVYGQRLTFGYDSNVHLTTITDAQGNIFTLSYNASGLCTNVADPFGRHADFEYDVNRNLTKITDMGNYWSSFTYDTNVYLTSIGNERGTWGFWIEPSGAYGNWDNYPPPGDTKMWANYRITITDPLGQRQEFFYYGGCDEVDHEFGCGYAWYVSPRDYVPWESQTVNNYRSRAPKTRFIPTLIASGQRGEIAKIVYPGGGRTTYGYDYATGNHISETDAHIHTNRYTYNAMGRVTSVTDAKGVSTVYTYSTNGVDLLSVSNGLGQILMAYNTQHNLILLTDWLTNTTTFTYNTCGQIISQVDALSITNEYLYDANQRLAEIRRAGQTLERFTYDEIGRIRTRTDATGLTVTNDYNTLNQVVRVTYPDSRFESYTYSTCCPRLLDSKTDRGGRTTVYIHDDLKRLIQTVNPEGGITQFGHDANGNRTSLTDPNGNITSFTYDLDNRLIRKTYDDGKGLSFGYDQAGLLTTRTNARGIVTSYTYDANHNLLSMMYSDDTPDVTNTYDAFNRLAIVKHEVGTNFYAYDANSRLTSFDGPWENDTITYGYNALGRRTNLAVQGSQPTGYNYDTLNRLISVRAETQTYAYTYAGAASPLVQRLDRPNGSFTTYQYDGLNRLTSLSNQLSNSGLINSFLYTYNAQDMRSSEIVSNGVAITFTNQHITYDYNRLNQLLTSAPPNQVCSYDDDGNMIRGFTPEGQSFIATYDAENRLSSIQYTNHMGGTFSNVYRYAAHYALAEIQRWSNGILSGKSRAVRDGFLEVQERDAANIVSCEYAWGHNMGGGVGGLLALKRSTGSYVYLYDGKGNVSYVLNAAQVVAASYVYDAFGNVFFRAGPLDQPYRFSTKYYDEMTGLSYFGYRYYTSTYGRWLTRDPIGERGGLNLYEYVKGDPVNNRDAYGLKNLTDDLWRYTTYCGEEKNAEDIPGFSPNSCFDVCCYLHDMCLYRSGVEWNSPCIAASWCNSMVVSCFIMCAGSGLPF